MTHRKKLIEVALPLEAINRASVRESFIYRGNPSAIHKWWAQRPLAAARAVLFAQMVDDPSEYLDVLRSDSKRTKRAESALRARKKVWDKAVATAARAAEAGIKAPTPGPEPTLHDVLADHERERLFRLIETLVLWENTTNPDVMEQARVEIMQSWRRACAANATHPDAARPFDRRRLPTFHDPFAGGATLPVEAQRLGLSASASDLNPVAVLINKAIIEFPQTFSNRPAVNPQAAREVALLEDPWKGSAGLAADIRYYGEWARSETARVVEAYYPTIEVTSEMALDRRDLASLVGQRLQVITWLWARTVPSPNPACRHVHVPLATTFMISTRKSKEVYVEPVLDGDSYRFEIRLGVPQHIESVKSGTKLSRGANFRCLLSGSPIDGDYIKAEGVSGRIGSRLMAIVAESDKGRVYLPPTPEHEQAASAPRPHWAPDVPISGSTQYLGTTLYGMTEFSHLFTNRQLMTLTAFADTLNDVREKIERDAINGDLSTSEGRLEDGGDGAGAYAEAIVTYLAFVLSKALDYNCTLVPWYSKEDRPGHLFSKQAIPMVWDYAELNPLSDIGGSFAASTKIISDALSGCPVGALRGEVHQHSAVSAPAGRAFVISTDPPYYDNVPYADLSDFFYVWLRRSLKSQFPSLFSTVGVPKWDELVAFAYRHKDGRAGAEAFFLDGMTRAMHRLAENAHPEFPVTIYYAFKQSESTSEGGILRTGWETFLDAVIRAGFVIGGTWPMRTERSARSRGIGANALATSIVLVCRPRPVDAASVSRRALHAALRAELPHALTHLQRGNIAPVDLAQAAIGPGMSVFTRYAQVLDAEGRPLSVRDALSLINETLDEALAEQEGDFDADSRWALAWFEHVGFEAGEYGLGETLSKAKNTSVSGLVDAGIVSAHRGRIRLLRPSELSADWNPSNDRRTNAWEMLHQLIRILEHAGEAAAATMVAQFGPNADIVRELAYRLYALAERKRQTPEALAYNSLVQSWPEIMRLVREGAGQQAVLFDQD